MVLHPPRSRPAPIHRQAGDQAVAMHRGGTRSGAICHRWSTWSAWTSRSPLGARRRTQLKCRGTAVRRNQPSASCWHPIGKKVTWTTTDMGAGPTLTSGHSRACCLEAVAQGPAALVDARCAL